MAKAGTAKKENGADLYAALARIVPLGEDEAMPLKELAGLAGETEAAVKAQLSAGVKRGRFAETKNGNWYQPGE